jgi:DNA-binding transcriptional MerR regulator
MMNKHNTFSIGDTARMTGVSQKQIRHWEGRYIPLAMRVVCGKRAYRYFSEGQVEQIKAIKALLDQGFTLAHAAQVAKNSNRKEVA